MRIDRAPASGDLLPPDAESEATTCGIKYTTRRRNHVWPHAIPRGGDDQVVVLPTPRTLRKSLLFGDCAHCIASRDPFVGALGAPEEIAASLFALLPPAAGRVP